MSKLLGSWLSNNKTFKGAIKLLFLTIFTLSQTSISAQIIAGDTALGQVISDPLVDLSISTVHETRFSLVDLDCDSIVDVKFVLHKSSTATDGSNLAYMEVLNPLIEICADTNLISNNHTVNYYDEADTLWCLDSNDWLNDTIYRLGDYGCWFCPGPWSVDSSYISYRNTATGQQGWIKISFDLYDSGGWGLPISLSVPEVLSPCVNTALPDPVYNDTIPDTTSITCGIFTFDAVVTPASCSGSCDGSVEILNLSGGTAPYSVIWNDPAATVGFVAMGLCSSWNITAVITDDNGVTCPHTFNVPIAPPMQIELQIDSSSCGNSDGSMCATVIGGTPPYTYYWNTPGPNDTMACANNLSAGNYVLTVTDSNGCVAYLPVFLADIAPVSFTLNSTNVSCANGNDGSSCITNLTGGTGPYMYDWSLNGSIVNTSICSSNMIAGSYTVCVTDANGCLICENETITEPAALIVTDSVTNASCPTCNDGEIQLIASGGTGAPTFSWTSAFLGVVPIATGLPIGNYSFCVTDANGCTTCDSATVSFTTGIQLTTHQNEFSIYPNPTTGVIIIDSEQEFERVIVRNVLGEIIKESNTNRIDLSNQPNGIYFVEVVTDKLKIVKKILLDK